jgi:triphosphoribosyl-dephospho-CoA synthetase
MRGAHSSVSRRIGRLATDALIAEASLSPKPGLVTPVSSGAHQDMDYRLFVVSARALEACFEACAFAGETAARFGASPGSLLGTLRTIGREGELAMFRATGGINTHKGAIFCLGLLSAAIAYLHAQTREQKEERFLGDCACEWVASLCSGLVERELSAAISTTPATAGERMFREHGARGARGQAEDGYPLLKDRILPILRADQDPGSDAFTRACLEALILSMSELEDSCLLSRGGRAGLEGVRVAATRVRRTHHPALGLGLNDLHDLDAYLCGQGLSPGGSADMLAAGIFLVLAEQRLASGCSPAGLGSFDRLLRADCRHDPHQSFVDMVKKHN